MRSAMLALAAVAAVSLGCRSSEETAGAAGEVPATVEAAKADDGRKDPRENYQEKVIGEVNREEARRDAAEERNRRIDEEPVQQAPQPPVEEAPPK